MKTYMHFNVWPLLVFIIFGLCCVRYEWLLKKELYVDFWA
jgi:hypothetical protein